MIDPVKLKELLADADNAMQARDKLSALSNLNDEYTYRALADLVPALARRIRLMMDALKECDGEFDELVQVAESPKDVGHYIGLRLMIEDALDK